MIVNAVRHCKDFVYNLLYFAEHSPTDSELPYLRNCILSLPDSVRAKYAKECEFVSSLSLNDMRKVTIPYPSRDVVPVDVAVGRMGGMPFIEHRRNGNLFFPSYMTDDGGAALLSRCIASR